MSRNHSYAQIPVSEAQEGASSSSSGPLSTLSRIPSSLSNSQGGSAGYSRVNAEDALDEREEEDDELTNENDVMLRPMRRQSHSEITVAQEDSITPLPSGTPQTQSQQLRSQLSSFRPPHFPVAAGARRVIQSTMDGVFSNLSAKPRVERPRQEELPPPYKAAALDQSPAYHEATTPSPYGDDELLVDGLPVGGFYGFAWNMIISMSFQFVGFFLTYLLHTSHATRSGSKMGLGITFISMGTQMMSGKAPGSDTPEDDSDTGYMGNAGESVKSVQEYIWLSYIMLFMGAAIMLHSGLEFLRAKRAEMIMIAAAASSSEAIAAAEAAASGEASSSGTSSAASVPPLTQDEINAIHSSAV